MLINLILVGIVFAIGFVVGYYVMKHKKEETTDQKCKCKEPQHNVTKRMASSEEKFDGSKTFQNELVSSLKAKKLKEIVRCVSSFFHVEHERNRS